MTTVVSSLQAIFTADTSLFDAATGRVESKLASLGNAVGGSIESVGTSITGMGAKIGMGIAPLAAAFGLGTKVASDFDVVMAEISARTGLVGEDLARVEQYALDMGAATAFSAQQAADAFLQLLSSGQTAEEAIATLPTVLDAAAASGASLGLAADLVTDIMAAFGLGVEEAATVTNALAKAAGASSADMVSLGQGFSNVGPIAKMYGLTVERTAAALAALSENGIKGAEAGTALKSMLMNMTRPTEDVRGAWEVLGTSFYDANGNARDLAEVLSDIDAALNSGKFTVEEQNELIKTLGGSYGAAALQALLSGDAISKMEAAMQSAATAEEVAAARMNTFAGATDSLKGSMETLAIRTLRPFMNNTLQPLIRTATEAVNVFADWAAEHPELVTAVGLLVTGLTMLSGIMVATGPVVAFFGAGIAALLSPIGLVAAAVAGLGIAFRENFLGFGDFVRDLWGSIQTLAGDIKSAFDQQGLEGVLAVVWDRIKTGAIDAVAWVKNSIVTPVVDAIKGVDWSEVPGQIDAILGRFLDAALEIDTWVWDNVISPIVDYLKGVDWSDVASKLGDLLEKFLGVAAAGITAMGVWVWDNIVGPIVDYLQNVNWSNQVSRLGDLLEKFLGVAAAGITAMGVWVWDNIVGPIVDYLKEVNWSDAGNKLLDLLGQLLGAAGAGIESAGAWAWDNIIQPIIDKLSSGDTWTAMWEAAKNLGAQLFDGLISALAGLPGKIADMILGAIPSDVYLGPAGSIHIGGHGAPIGFGAPEETPSPRGFGARAAGGPFRLRVGEFGPEELVMTSPLAGYVVPSAEVRRAEDERRITISGGTFILQGVHDVQKLYDQLQQVAMRRAY